MTRGWRSRILGEMIYQLRKDSYHISQRKRQHRRVLPHAAVSRIPQISHIATNTSASALPFLFTPVAIINTDAHQLQQCDRAGYR